MVAVDAEREIRKTEGTILSSQKTGLCALRVELSCVALMDVENVALRLLKRAFCGFNSTWKTLSLNESRFSIEVR